MNLTFPNLQTVNIYGYDELSNCLDNNTLEADSNIVNVLAYVPGAAAELEYHWLVRLRDHTLGVVSGFRGYGDWDRVSTASLTVLDKFNPLELPAKDISNRPVRDLLAFQHQYFGFLYDPKQSGYDLTYRVPREYHEVFSTAENLLNQLGMKYSDGLLIYEA